MEATRSSETSVRFYQTTLRHAPEGDILQTLLRKRDIKRLSPIKSFIKGRKNLRVTYD
jgi:hypothetical protein